MMSERLKTIRVIDNITASIDDKRKIYEGNARKIVATRLIRNREVNLV
jgi:hypothetical protein